MATALSSPLSDPGGCLICQRLALAVVLVDLGNTSKEIIRCFSITARFAGSHRSLQPNTARLPVQSVSVTIRQKTRSFQNIQGAKSHPAGRKSPCLLDILGEGVYVFLEYLGGSTSWIGNLSVSSARWTC